MKKNIVLFLILIVSVAFGQTEKPESKMAADSFVDHYNAEKYDEIYAMFSSEMQSALPLDETTKFLQGLMSQAGKINKRAFLSYKNGSYAAYKTEFEKAVLEVHISVDSDSMINGLYVKPFVEEKPRNVTNNLILEKGSVNKKQSELIFENTKSFPNQTQLSIAVIENGVVSFYGTKSEKDRVSNVQNSSSIFEIGSISKVFTATLLADFVVNKQLKLNDAINDYLRVSIKDDTKITFEQLANHTSGLPRLPTNLDLATADPSNPYKNYGAKELDEYLTQLLETKQTPGSKNEYSHLGAGLLGYVLAKHSDSSYEALLQKHLFSKFNMSHSTSLRQNIKNPLVIGLDGEGKQTSNWDLAILAGAGGIFSNVEDQSKFVVAQFDSANKALTLTRQKTFKINANMDIGLGWHILKDKSENNWYWHNGGTGGYRSSMVFDPISKNGIVILSNVSAFNPDSGNIDTLGFALMASLDLSSKQ
jgi:CubicO group peptidase (beta-lactamase class C family)